MLGTFPPLEKSVALIADKGRGIERGVEGTARGDEVELGCVDQFREAVEAGPGKRPLLNSGGVSDD